MNPGDVIRHQTDALTAAGLAVEVTPPRHWGRDWRATVRIGGEPVVFAPTTAAQREAWWGHLSGDDLAGVIAQHEQEVTTSVIAGYLMGLHAGIRMWRWAMQGEIREGHPAWCRTVEAHSVEECAR